MDSNILNKLRSSDYLDHIAGMDAFIAINNEIAAAIIHDLKIAGSTLLSTRILRSLSPLQMIAMMKNRNSTSIFYSARTKYIYTRIL